MGIWRFRMRSYAKVDNESDLVVGLIPARWASTRFEGKPLVDISGIPMIKRVYDRACMAKYLDTVVVLTDDERIAKYCSSQEMRCIVIDESARSGTDRCAAALNMLDGRIFVNIQGDEPLINPDAIDTLVEQFGWGIGVANAYVDIDQDYKLTDENVVKVTMNKNNHALYYSRLPISEYQQMGLYAFSRDMLSIFPTLPVGKNEEKESVEMLRYLENGYMVKMVKVDDDGLSVDTPHDVKLVELKLGEYH